MAILLEAPTIERLRDGIRVVLAGAPNAGKSTLLNVLAERDAAIVSPISGTTRDRIDIRSEEHTSELQSLMRISYAVFCLKKKKKITRIINRLTINNHNDTDR